MLLYPEDRRERSSNESRGTRLSLPEIFAGSAAVGFVMVLGYQALSFSTGAQVAPPTPAPVVLAVADPTPTPVDEVPAGVDLAPVEEPVVAAPPEPTPIARPRRTAARRRPARTGDLDAIVRRAAEVEALQAGGE